MEKYVAENQNGLSYSLKSSQNHAMKGQSEVNNLSEFSVNKDVVLEIVDTILKEEGKKSKRVSVAIVDSKKMKELSRIYRDKDYVTDVLSFFYNENSLLGEVVLCPEKIKENGKNKSFPKEFYRVMIHGVLHLLGYHHSKKEEEEVMEKKTEYYLKIFHKKIILET